MKTQCGIIELNKTIICDYLIPIVGQMRLDNYF